MKRTYVRVNGRGNAWPVQLGLDHPFYSRKNSEELANASFSIFNEDEGNICWSVLVDAGHGVIQYLLKHENRIPEAIFLTHPHHDHTWSIDWVIQSYFRQHDRTRKYPVYATRGCMDLVLEGYPHLEPMTEFIELEYKMERHLEGAPGVTCTAYPVYHGAGTRGAAMLLFRVDGAKVLFTGDLLCPVVSDADMETLRNINLVFADGNTRFPCPASNHWSISGQPERQL